MNFDVSVQTLSLLDFVTVTRVIIYLIIRFRCFGFADDIIKQYHCGDIQHLTTSDTCLRQRL